MAQGHCAPTLLFVAIAVALCTPCTQARVTRTRTNNHASTVHPTSVYQAAASHQHHRPYLHMVSKPSDAFAKPIKGTWVYFIAVSPNKRHYLHWALASIQSLKAANTIYDTTVFFDGDDDLAVEAFRKLGVTNVFRYEEYVAKVLNKLTGVDVTAFHEANKASEHGSYYHSYNKLLAWTLEGYDKAVLIDADIIAWNNADELFYYPELSAVPDMIWSLMEPDYSLIFNTGLMVIQPNVSTFKGMVAGIKGYRRPDVFWWDNSEQIYVNHYFNNTWFHLPNTYNFLGFLLEGAFRVNWRVDSLRLVHNLRESQFPIPPSPGEKSCQETGWASCKLCCVKLVEMRDAAFAALERVGMPAHMLQSVSG